MNYLLLDVKPFETHQVWFWIPFIFLLLLTFLLRNSILKDASAAKKKPYSYSRTQLVWWSIIVLSCFIAVYFNTGYIPTFYDSTLILLGISAGTLATAKLTDNSDAANPNITRTQDDESKGFLNDILSDENGISIHRFQAVVFNVIIGLWFVQQFLCNLKGFHQCSVVSTDCHFPACLDCVLDVTKKGIDSLIPDISNNNLILIGLSAGTYAALKTTENKTTPTNTDNTGTGAGSGKGSDTGAANTVAAIPTPPAATDPTVQAT